MKVCAALLGATLGMAAVASAQTAGPMRVTTEIETPPAEVTAGVAMTLFQKDIPAQPEFGSLGVSLSISGNLGPYIGMVANVDRFASSENGVDDSVQDFLAGLRVQSRFFRVGRGRDMRDLRIFAHVLAGIRDSDRLVGGRAIQPGLGVDFHTKQGIALRYEFDHCFVAGPGRGLSGGQFLFGLVFGPS